MNAVIKSGDAAGHVHVRALPVARPVHEPAGTAAPAIDPEIAALRRAADSLAGQLEQRDAEIERLKGQVQQARDEGEARGREAGLKDAGDQQAAALALLEKGVDRATAAFTAEMESLERLAVLVAQEGLAKVLGDSASHSELIGKIIRNHVERIGAAAVVRVSVSGQDFTDGAALTALEESIGRSNLNLQVCDDLRSGDCEVKLVLGVHEIGPRQQWGRLSGLLEDLASPPVSA